jgi:hypothetical protein
VKLTSKAARRRAVRRGLLEISRGRQRGDRILIGDSNIRSWGSCEGS